MVHVLHLGKQPRAAVDQTIKVWLRCALLLAALVFTGLFADGVRSSAQADSYMSMGISCGNTCKTTDTPQFTFGDSLGEKLVTQFVGFRYIDIGIASYSFGLQINPVCYDVYLDDIYALNLSKRLAANYCTLPSSNSIENTTSFVWAAPAAGSFAVPQLPQGQHTISVRRLWVPLQGLSPGWDYISTFNFNVTQRTGMVATGGTPQSTTVQKAFPVPLQVTVKDDSGAPASNVTVTFTAPAGNATANLSSQTATTDSNGVASVTATASGYGGSYVVTATVSGGAAPVFFSLTNAGTPARIITMGGTPQSGSISLDFPVPLQVMVTDDSGNPTSGVEVTFVPMFSSNHITSATIPTAPVKTNAQGIVSVIATANNYSGSYEVWALIDGGTSPAVFKLSNYSTLTYVKAASGTPQSAQVTQPYSVPLKVRVTDDTGAPAGGILVSFFAPTTGASAAFSSQTARTDTQGNASITATANGLSGNFAVTAWVAGISTPASFALTNQVPPNLISFAKPADTPFSAPPPPLGATATSGLPVAYSSSTPSVCNTNNVNQSGAVVISFIAVGTCTILANQAGDGTHTAAIQVAQSFSIVQGSNVITFAKPADTVFSAAPPTLAATASSKLAVTYYRKASICIPTFNPFLLLSFGTCLPTASVCTVTPAGTITFVSAGICSIAASQGGDSNYMAATPVTQSFNIGLATQAITATPSPTSMPHLGTSQITVTGKLGTGALSYAVKSGTCTASASGLATAGAGSGPPCVVTATLAADNNYQKASSDATIIMTKAMQTITFSQPADVTYAPSGTVTLSATGGASTSPVVLSIDAASGSGVCSISGSTVSFTGAGRCIVDANQASDANYNAAAQVQQSFAVAKAAQMVAITSPAPVKATVSGTPYAVTATGGASTSPVVLSIDATSGAGVCSISGSTVSFTGAGSCIVDANQAGDANYNAAAQVQQTIVVSKTVTNVILTSYAPAAVFGAPITFSATVGGGKSPTGTVTFKDGAVVIATQTLSGTTATFTTKTLAIGNHSIVATYNGDRINEVSSSSALAIVVKTRPNPAFNAGVVGLIAAQTSTANRFGQSQISNTLNRLDELHDEDGAQCELAEKDCLTAGKGPALSPKLGHAADGKPLSITDDSAADSTLSGSLSSNASSSATFNAPDMNKQANGIGSPGSIGPLYYAPPVQDPISGPGHVLLTIASVIPIAVKALDNTNTLPFHVWTAGSINFGSANADGTYNNHFTTSGLSLGADRKFFEGFKAGVALGLGLDHTAVGTDGTRSDARSYSASVYGSYRIMPKTFLDAVLGYGRMNFNLRRWSADSNILLSAKRAGQEFFGSLRLTQDIKINSWKFSPYVRLDVIKINLAAYEEAGSDIWALSYGKLNSTTVSAVLGTRISYAMPTNWGTLTPFLHIEYDHALSGKYSQSLSYTDLPGTNYLINGTAQATDLFSSGLGLRAKTENGLDIDLEYLVSATPRQIQGQTIRASIKQAF